MNVPDELMYTKDHEWIAATDGSSRRLGITDYAQDQLGDIVYVDLPTVGSMLQAGAVAVEVESTKSVGEVYAPFAGTVTAVNEALVDSPELVNADPYGAGWLLELEPDGDVDSDTIDAGEYKALTD